MEQQDIKEVFEIADHQRLVNDYLGAGWVLLATVSDGEENRGWFKYSLGWPKDGPAPHFSPY